MDALAREAMIGRNEDRVDRYAGSVGDCEFCFIAAGGMSPVWRSQL